MPIFLNLITLLHTQLFYITECTFKLKQDAGNVESLSVFQRFIHLSWLSLNSVKRKERKRGKKENMFILYIHAAIHHAQMRAFSLRQHKAFKGCYNLFPVSHYCDINERK